MSRAPRHVATIETFEVLWQHWLGDRVRLTIRRGPHFCGFTLRIGDDRGPLYYRRSELIYRSEAGAIAAAYLELFLDGRYPVRAMDPAGASLP